MGLNPPNGGFSSMSKGKTRMSMNQHPYQMTKTKGILQVWYKQATMIRYCTGWRCHVLRAPLLICHKENLVKESSTLEFDVFLRPTPILSKQSFLIRSCASQIDSDLDWIHTQCAFYSTRCHPRWKTNRVTQRSFQRDVARTTIFICWNNVACWCRLKRKNPIFIA